MITFVLQTVNNKVVHDFVFELERAIEYQKWRGNEFDSRYSSIENLMSLNIENIELKNIVPVGTVEFVLKFCEIFLNKKVSSIIKPINVPQKLFHHSGSYRNIQNITLTEENRNKLFDEYKFYDLCFVKSNEQIKSKVNGQYNVTDLLNCNKIPNGDYQISNYIYDIESEYRCFIYKDELLGIQWYSGDYTIFPDVNRIKTMIKEYRWDYGYGNGAPQAYTLDVGISDEETFVIECHDFFSCGLYGFCDYEKLPFMFIRAFNNIRNNLLKYE